MPTVRSYRQQDRDAVLDICLRTGDNGQDATGLNGDDRLLPMIFADPYLSYQPELAQVVQDGSAVTGYILGASNTPAFVGWYREVWLSRTAPILAQIQNSRPDRGPESERWVDLHRNPERMLHKELADYPAHLHIDLLPAAQGSGMGSMLMERFLEQLQKFGVGGVHLAMSATNVGAGHFYRRMGFQELNIDQGSGTTFFGRRTQSE